MGILRRMNILVTKKGLAPKLIYLSDGNAYLKEEQYYFYLMEFVSGRQLEETIEDEFLLGQAAAKLHQLTDFNNLCSFNSEQQKKIFHDWFSERSFKTEYDAILDSLPNFNDYEHC